MGLMVLNQSNPPSEAAPAAVITVSYLPGMSWPGLLRPVNLPQLSALICMRRPASLKWTLLMVGWCTATWADLNRWSSLPRRAVLKPCHSEQMCRAGWMVGGRVQLRREKMLSCRDGTLLWLSWSMEEDRKALKQDPSTETRPFLFLK